MDVGMRVGLDRQPSPGECSDLQETIKLVDENGREYQPIDFISLDQGGSTLVVGSDGYVAAMWSAEYACSFSFEVGAESTTFTLLWAEYPPLEIGDLSESPFCLGCE